MPRRPLSPGFLHLLRVTRPPVFLLPSIEVLTQEGGLLLVVVMSVRWG